MVSREDQPAVAAAVAMGLVMLAVAAATLAVGPPAGRVVAQGAEAAVVELERWAWERVAAVMVAERVVVTMAEAAGTRGRRG